MRFSSVFLFLTGICISSVVLATSEDDYEKALTAYNQTRYDEAFIHLKNSLQLDPNNLAAKILMGKLLLMNGYLMAAETEFFEALDQGADINLIAEPLGNALLFQNKYDKVINFTETDKLTGDYKISWLQIRASACIRLNKLDCANDAYNDILKADPNNTQAYNGLASVALFQKNLELADSLLAKAIASDNENSTTWRLKGELAHANQDFDSAIDYLQKSLKLAPEDPNTLRKLADIYLESNDYDSARAFVDEIIDKTPNDPLAILLSSWLESKDKEKLVSNARLEQLNSIMASLSPEIIAEQPILLYISGLTAFFHGNTEQAAKDFSQYLTKKPNDIQAIVLLARTYLMTQQNKQALTLLEKHEDKLVENIDSALLLGDLYLKQNRAFKAQKLSDKLVSAYPNDSRVQLFEIRLMAARGKIEEALRILDSAYENNKDKASFLFTYSMMKLQAGYEREALKSAQAILTLYPDEPEFMNLKAGIHIRLREYDEAMLLLDKALAIDPELFAAKFNKAAILSRREDFEASNNIVEELLATSPKHPQSLLLKAHNKVQQGEIEKALDLYSDILVLNNDFNYARFELAKLYRALKDYDQSVYHIDRLLVDDFDNPEYLLFKTELYIQKRNISEAKKTLSIVEHFTTDSIEQLLKQSELQRAIDDIPAALKSLEKALALQPENSRIKLNIVRLLISTNEYKKAQDILTSMGASSQTDANYWLVNAIYQNATGKTGDAVSDIRKALSLDPNYHQALVFLYELALKNGYQTAFVEEAKKVVSKSPQNLLAKNLLAQFYYIQQDFENAKPIYLSLLDKKGSFNPSIVYNKLAIMSLGDDINQAYDYIKKAFELNESEPDILDTYGWVLVQKGKAEEGLGYLRKAFARDSNNPEIRYHLGFALAKLNRNQEAVAELEKAVSAQRPFYNRQKAQELLDSLQ